MKAAAGITLGMILGIGGAYGLVSSAPVPQLACTAKIYYQAKKLAPGSHKTYGRIINVQRELILSGKGGIVDGAFVCTVQYPSGPKI